MIGCANSALMILRPLTVITPKPDEMNVAVARNWIKNGETGPNEAFATIVMRPVNWNTRRAGALLALAAIMVRAANLTVPIIPGEAAELLVARPLTGTLPVGALCADVIDVNVARSAKKANKILRDAELIVCRAAKPTLPLIIGAALDITVAVPRNASLPATATRNDAIADIVALKAKKDGSGPRIAELIV